MAAPAAMDDSGDLSSAPSSPLSLLSASPSPPPEDLAALGGAYPSPPASQQTSQSGSPGPDSDVGTPAADGPPPAKRRRISKDGPKERSTEHLDLRGNKIDPDQRPQLDRLLHVLHKKQKIVVIAGAGISVSAGIPDFRSSQGLFKSLKDDYKLKGSGKDLFDASVYKDDSSTSSFHDMVSTMSRLTKDAKPTPFHHMLATIAKEDRLLRLYSQNVDGIDTALPPLKTCVPLRKADDGKWPRTVQLHGGLDKMVCSKCHELSDLDASLFSGPVPPLCPACEEINNIRTQHEGKRSHGIGRLRPRMVLYNEHNPDDEAIGAVTKEDLRKRPDAVIVVGTTLKVPGVRRIVREMCGVVRDRRGGVTVWINNDPPPPAKDLEDCWDIVVQGKCDEVARRAAMRHWDLPPLADDFREVTDAAAHAAGLQTVFVAPSPEAPPHLKREALPSAAHRNNSFLPPPAGVHTPKKLVKHAPTPSPVTVPRFSNLVRRVSVDSDTSAFITEDEAVPTPTPSKKRDARGFAKPPAISAPKSTKPSSTSTAAKAPKGKLSKPAPKPRPANAKKAAAPRRAAKAKPEKSTLLTSAFKQRKAVSVSGAKNKGKDLGPSKLFLMSTAAAEPMHDVSLRDGRANASPPLLDVSSPVIAVKMPDPAGGSDGGSPRSNFSMRIADVVNP